MITINETATMHELLSQVMESRREVMIYVDGKPFVGLIASLSSEFVELDSSFYPEVKPTPTQTIICINSIKVISLYPEAKNGKKEIH